MNDVIHSLQSSARLVKAWGDARLENGATLREALRLDGLSLWDVVAVDLAVYFVPRALALGTQPRSFAQHVRARLSLAKHLAIGCLPFPKSPPTCIRWPRQSTFLFLGFTDYLYRDVLQPVVTRLKSASDVAPVAIYDGRQPRPTAFLEEGDRLHSVWRHWDAGVEARTRMLLKTLRVAVAELIRSGSLARITRDVNGRPLWPLMRETFGWLFRVHLPRLLPQAAIAWHILEHHRPALVISPDVADPRTRMYCLLGHRLGIPSLEIVFGDLVGRECIEWQFFVADRLAAAGESTREIVMELGVPPERVTVTGSPRHDLMINASAAEIGQTRARLGLRDDRAMIVFASTLSLNAYDGMRDPKLLASVKRAIFSAADQIEDVCLVVKPHPLENVRETRRLAKGYRNIVFVDPRVDIRELTKACDAFVTLGSTSTLGALIINKLVIWPAFHGVIYWDDKFVNSGAVLVPQSKEELVRSLQMVANESRDKTLADLEPARQRFLRQWVSGTDGQATTRVEALARQMAVVAHSGRAESPSR